MHTRFSLSLLRSRCDDGGGGLLIYYRRPLHIIQLGMFNIAVRAKQRGQYDRNDRMAGLARKNCGQLSRTHLL